MPVALFVTALTIGLMTALVIHVIRLSPDA